MLKESSDVAGDMATDVDNGDFDGGVSLDESD